MQGAGTPPSPVSPTLSTAKHSATPATGTSVKLSSNAIAGVAGGFASSVLTHPLDVVKTRFQVHDGKHNTIPKYRSTVHAIFQIARSEGPRTLYAGLAPNLLGSTISWGCYFYGYNYLRGIARTQDRFVDRAGQPTPPVNFACATMAGACTCLATNPIWLIKTRLQLQHGTAQRYAGMIDAARQVIRQEGVLGLYRGLVPSLLLVSHGALQFMAYEEIKKRLRNNRNDVEHLLPWESFLAGAAAKVFASTVTYPSQVVRARLQQMDPYLLRQLAESQAGSTVTINRQARYYQGFLDCTLKIVRLEGVFGFYKGLAPNLMRVVPSAAITFAVYEAVAKFLGART
eukprot:CAMPEP_0196727144 /NCGR_PEP_ID=MMETSP1091-20130531/8204_1 /TAXON_ID=302021 /ORGANISM="Rhodomonas sp., Strain CCMP768" /LENGTH=342 /DNA_ID=CAMNT_0042069689 /DNA_START=41 /DNA_END=1069 /DNA_ORIENTATION=-